MTHDELLAKVKQIESFASYDPFQNAIIALRAVVELHKPISSDWNTILRCCKCRYSDGDLFPYPCPTIQAIEKELK